MTSIQRVVSIGAHSLDAELMGGPLILKYARQGAHCTLIHVTQGRLEDPAATEEAKQAYLKDLLTMNQKAAEKLGADTIWLGYVSSNMPSLEDFAQRMEQYFVDEKVDLVITHWRGSMPVSYTHLRAHETGRNLVCRLLLEKKKKHKQTKNKKKKKQTKKKKTTR